MGCVLVESELTWLDPMLVFLLKKGQSLLLFLSIMKDRKLESFGRNAKLWIGELKFNKNTLTLEFNHN